MPKQVLKKVVRIQREFLWGGTRGGRKINWIKWKVVCKSKLNGGLGVRDLKVVNLSLLMKWRWRLLQHDERSLWKEVLVAKYGNHITHNVSWYNSPPPYFASRWWKDIVELEECVEGRNWLVDSIDRKMGNGAYTRFWEDSWVGNARLCDSFPRLFSLSLQKGKLVSEVGEVVEGTVVWSLNWRRRLFQWEEDSLANLLASLANILLSSVDDGWRWNVEPDGIFSVKSSYDSLSYALGDLPPPSELEEFAWANIWKSPAPSKLIVFSWQLLHGRLPTKDNLISRRVFCPQEDSSCVWCTFPCESSLHLFLHCNMAHVIWYDIFRWLGVVIVMPNNVFTLFECLCGAAKNIKVRKGYMLVWHATLWIIWLARNNRIFKEVIKNSADLVEEIKVMTWRWGSERLHTAPCLFYEWSWDPGICFQS
jgi:hypothetical protein